MMIEQLIADADPVDHADPALDPDHPRARALLAAATAAPPPRSRRMPRRVAVAAVAVAAGVVALADGPAPLPARAAMVQAAERTADFSSGRIVTTGELEVRSTASTQRFATETRYDGDRVSFRREMRGVDPDGNARSGVTEIRQIDGKLYERAGDEPWRLLGPGSVSPELTDVERQTRSAGLVEVLAGAEGAARVRSAAGEDVIRATVPAADLDSVPLPSALLPIASVQGDDMVVTATIDGDGLLRAVEVRHDGDHAHLLWRTEYRDLGVPQEIVAPS